MENDGNYQWAVAGSHQNKDGKDEEVDVHHGIDTGTLIWDMRGQADREGGSQRMWVIATAPTSSHNETLFLCLTGHFLLRVFLALQVCNLREGGSDHS